MEMKWFFLCCVAMLLIGCQNGEGPDPREQEIIDLQARIETLETSIQAKDGTIQEKDDAYAALEEELADLEAELAKSQQLYDQQRSILREMDDERAEAVLEAENCTGRIDELEENNDKLIRMIAICQEELE